MFPQTVTKLITADEAATMLGLSRQTLAIWRCERKQGLSYVKCGGRVRYCLSDVEAFIARNTQVVAEPSEPTRRSRRLAGLPRLGA